MKKTVMLLLFITVLIFQFNCVNAQNPPFFTDFIDCDGCLINPPPEPRITQNCPHVSPLYSDPSFYRINPASQIKYVRVNFIIVQKDDGTGNFSESNPEDQQMLSDIQSTMNQTLANLNVSACNGTNVHSKIQYYTN